MLGINSYTIFFSKYQIKKWSLDLQILIDLDICAQNYEYFKIMALFYYLRYTLHSLVCVCMHHVWLMQLAVVHKFSIVLHMPVA